MPRDARAYLADVIEACEAITTAVGSMDFREYANNRLVRSSVEREFILIGEALAALNRTAEDLFASLTQARRIVDFRNQLTHEYPTVDDTIVWAIIGHDVSVLRRECLEHLQRQTPSTDSSADTEAE